MSTVTGMHCDGGKAGVQLHAEFDALAEDLYLYP